MGAKATAMRAPIISDEDLLHLAAEGHEAIVAALIEALRPHVRRGRLGHEVRTITAGEELDGEEVVPGFRGVLGGLLD